MILWCCVSLAGVATGQTVRTWTSNSDLRWSLNANWSGNNRPDANNEIAAFGSGLQLNPRLNANNYTVRGIRFLAGASGYDVADDNGSRTLKIGNGTAGFIENLSTSDQVISIATLQFQSAATVTTADTARLTISSSLTGTNRNLTFDATGNISVSGSIATGSGTLTKIGAGDLNLSGTNTYTGTTVISAGAIVLGASSVFANNAVITVAAGASLRLNDLSDTIGRISGAGEIDFGAGGTGQLTLASGTSSFAGTFTGSGELVIGTGATLTLGADFANSGINVTLAGGTLNLAGHTLTLGALTISGSSTIDFGSATNSTLSVGSLAFTSSGFGLSVQNWVNAADYFYSQAGYAQNAAPLNQVQFAGWGPADTKWQSYDNQVTPVTESGAYGGWLVAMTVVAVGVRRVIGRDGGAPIRRCHGA